MVQTNEILDTFNSSFILIFSHSELRVEQHHHHHVYVRESLYILFRISPHSPSKCSFLSLFQFLILSATSLLFFSDVYELCVYFFYVSFFSSNFRTPKNKIHLLFAYYFSRFSLLSTGFALLCVLELHKMSFTAVCTKKNTTVYSPHLSASCLSQARSTTTRYK